MGNQLVTEVVDMWMCNILHNFYLHYYFYSSYLLFVAQEHPLKTLCITSYRLVLALSLSLSSFINQYQSESSEFRLCVYCTALKKKNRVR